MYTYTYVYIHACTIYIRIYLYIYICKYKFVYKYIQRGLVAARRAHEPSRRLLHRMASRISTHPYKHDCECAQLYIHLCLHLYTLTLIYTLIYTRIYTYIYAHDCGCIHLFLFTNIRAYYVFSHRVHTYLVSSPLLM